jgi:type VI secretion system protein ImpC
VIEYGDDLAGRPTPAVDLDNLDDVLFRYAPRLHLPLADPAAPSMLLELRKMDDFHPDALYRSLDAFRAMRELRQRMLDPRTFAAEAEALRAAREAQRSPLSDRPAIERAAPVDDEGELFERLLGRKPGEQPRPRPRQPEPGLDITPFIRAIVRPYVVSAKSTDQEHLVASVDQAIGMQMREVLRDPGFRGLEAAWRGVEWLIQRVELSEDVELCLLDVSKQELAADLAMIGGELHDSGLYRLLVERAARTPGSRPWSVLVGNYVLGTSDEDVALLRALGAIGSRAGAPFIAAGAPSVVGCRSVAAEPDPRRWIPLEGEAERRWMSLRASAEARWIGLALPRFLLRLPYGARTEPIDAFDFEEQPAAPEHEAYLWGNPSIACAMLLAAAFADRGWSMQPGDRLEIDDLPAHVFEDGGESRMTACAEAYLTETAGDAILRRGIMPILSYRDRNAARLVRFQSLAEPPAALAGRWR